MKRSRLKRKGSKARPTRMVIQKEPGVLGVMEFTSPIVKERSISPVAEQLGVHKSKMTLREGKENLFIEWEISDLDEVVEIGIFTKGKKVYDYDGVFELPKQAIALLKKSGLDVSEVI